MSWFLCFLMFYFKRFMRAALAMHCGSWQLSNENVCSTMSRSSSSQSTVTMLASWCVELKPLWDFATVALIIILLWTGRHARQPDFCVSPLIIGLRIRAHVGAQKLALRSFIRRTAWRRSTGETRLTFAEISSEIWWRFRAVDGGIPFTQKSSFRYEILAPRLRLRRDVLFSYEDLIVSFGGVAAFFLGYNFWGTSEMFYFFIDKAVKFVYERFVKR